MFNNPPETRFGGDFRTPTDWHDPLIDEQFAKPGNWALFTLNKFGANTIDYLHASAPIRRRPAAGIWLGTDEAGRDMVARLLYGFRISVLFGLALTFVGTALGIAIGAVQGYFGGRIDLVHAARDRDLELDTGAVPADHHRVDLRAVVPAACSVVLALFGWIGLSDYVRAEFLRNRNLEFVKAARAMGLSNWQIMWRHVLPNSHDAGDHLPAVPHERRDPGLTVARLPRIRRARTCRRSATCCAQGKENLDAWWIIDPDLRGAGLDLAAAHLHRRRAARRIRHAEVLTCHRLPQDQPVARGRPVCAQLRRRARGRSRVVRASAPARNSRWSASRGPASR